jgi:hypothetical protein
MRIPEVTPSSNAFLWKHWSVKRKIRKDWSLYVLEAKHNARALVKATSRAHLTIHRYAARRLDIDNLVGGCKFLIDALVEQGLLLGDSPDLLHVEYRQTPVKEKAERGMVLRIVYTND